MKNLQNKQKQQDTNSEQQIQQNSDLQISQINQSAAESMTNLKAGISITSSNLSDSEFINIQTNNSNGIQSDDNNNNNKQSGNASNNSNGTVSARIQRSSSSSVLEKRYINTYSVILNYKAIYKNNDYSLKV